MNATTCTNRNPFAKYELRFQFLFDEGRALAFRCDATGLVNLDALSKRERNNYFRARTLVGRDYAVPQLRVASSA